MKQEKVHSENQNKKTSVKDIQPAREVFFDYYEKNLTQVLNGIYDAQISFFCWLSEGNAEASKIQHITINFKHAFNV